MGLVKNAKLPCPFDDCDSSDAYHIFEDDSGWCFSCNRGTWNKPKIEDCTPKFTDFRGVSKDVQERLNFLSYVDDKGNVLFREYKYANGSSKFREVLAKRFWSVGQPPKISGEHLWNAGSASTVCVVEGEEDQASFMCMSDLPVFALTSASLGSDLRQIHEALSPFKKIVLAFESDDAGSQAKQKIGSMFPGKVFEASLTRFKDANEYLVNGAEKEFYWAVVNARKYTADFVFNSNEDFREILSQKDTNFVVETPFPSLNKLIKGLPLGRIVVLTGQEGLGKTEILRAMEYNCLKNYPDVPISITHHEENKRDVLTGLASYELNKNCRSVDTEITDDEIMEALDKINPNGNLHLTEIGTEVESVKEVMDRINYLVTVCGVKYFFIDPINQFEPPDDGKVTLVRFLDSLCKAMAKFVVAKNVCCVWTAHVNDEGLTRDSRMISKMAGIRLDISRDHMHEDETIRNTTKILVSKNRPYSKTGVAGDVSFEPESFTMYEKELPF